jgi:hypothetical protein
MQCNGPQACLHVALVAVHRGIMMIPPGGGLVRWLVGRWVGGREGVSQLPADLEAIVRSPVCVLLWGSCTDCIIMCWALLSRHNQGEAQAAMAHVQRLLAAGLGPADIGIITPYSAQVRAAAMLFGRACFSLPIHSVQSTRHREYSTPCQLCHGAPCSLRLYQCFTCSKVRCRCATKHQLCGCAVCSSWQGLAPTMYCCNLCISQYCLTSARQSFANTTAWLFD